METYVWVVPEVVIPVVIPEVVIPEVIPEVVIPEVVIPEVVIPEVVIPDPEDSKTPVAFIEPFDELLAKSCFNYS